VYDESENVIRYAKKGLILDPQSVKTSSAYISLYWAYMNLCDFKKAEQYAQKAIHQDINSADKSQALFLMGHLNMVLGHYDEVIKYANEHLKNNKNGWYQIAEAYGRFKGDWEKALTIYDSLWKVQPDHTFPNRYAIALWKTGNKEKAARILDSLITIYRNSNPLDGRIGDYDMAGVLAFRGYKEDAYKILRKPPENTKVWGAGFPFLIKTDPLFDNLRNDQEFKYLVKKASDEIGIRREKIRKMEEDGKL
jgi:tetratricopeptide (TPR) repeat protein